MTSDVRILTGWTENERKELEEAEDNDFNSAIDLIRGIINDEDDCISLAKKYMDEYSDEDNQMVKDIADYYCGVAKFPDKKYFVQLIRNNDGSYLNRNTLNTFLTLDSCHSTRKHQTKFTEQEIKDIDPRYMAFAVPVEDDNE